MSNSPYERPKTEASKDDGEQVTLQTMRRSAIAAGFFSGSFTAVPVIAVGGLYTAFFLALLVGMLVSYACWPQIEEDSL